MPVLAKYASDDVWYRATVSGVLKASHQYEVQFVDYGNRGLVSLVDLRDISARFLALPMQVITCSLHGVTRSTGSYPWNQDIIEKFRELCDDKEFQMYWTGEQDQEQRHYIHLLSGQENINRSFLRSVKMLRPDYASPVVSTAPSTSPRHDLSSGDVSRTNSRDQDDGRRRKKSGLDGGFCRRTRLQQSSRPGSS